MYFQPQYVAYPQQAPVPSLPSYEAVVLDPQGPRSHTNLFVRKLASAVTEADLERMFHRYGNVLSMALMRDIHSGESLGTAFIRYETYEEAKAAMAALDGEELYGRGISIQWAKKQHDSTPVGEAREKIHKLFVRNIPINVTSEELKQLFEPYGEIGNITIHSDTAPSRFREDGRVIPERKIAFVLFQRDGAAMNAVAALHSTCPFPGCEGIPLMVKLAEDNRQRLERKMRYSGSGTGLMGMGSASTTPTNPALMSPPAMMPLMVGGGAPFAAAAAPTAAAYQQPSYVYAGATAPPAGVFDQNYMNSIAAAAAYQQAFYAANMQSMYPQQVVAAPMAAQAQPHALFSPYAVGFPYPADVQQTPQRNSTVASLPPSGIVSPVSATLNPPVQPTSVSKLKLSSGAAEEAEEASALKRLAANMKDSGVQQRADTHGTIAAYRSATVGTH